MARSLGTEAVAPGFVGGGPLGGAGLDDGGADVDGEAFESLMQRVAVGAEASVLGGGAQWMVGQNGMITGDVRYERTVRDTYVGVSGDKLEVKAQTWLFMVGYSHAIGRR